MRVLVVTVAHRGDDARIVHRQIRSLLDAGHSVTLVAPDPGDEARRLDPPGLSRVAVPRAVGRRRSSSWRAARRAVGELGAIDVVLLHDPELVPVLGIGRRRGRVVVWDVHEDYVASVGDRRWLPGPVRPVVRAAVRALVWFARQRLRIVVAEHSYRDRFPNAPVVPNSTWVAESPASVDEPRRVVYVGRVSFGRGAAALVSVGEELSARGGPRLVVVGAADREVEALLRDAHDRGVLEWRGPLANPEAMRLVRGAVAGLSLLLDEPNYRHSQPTKVMEYMAQGTPVITTPLPLAAELVTTSAGGVVTRQWSGPALVDEVVDAVMTYAGDSARRDAHGSAGWRHAREHLDWNRDGAQFVRTLEAWVQETGRSTTR